MRIEPVKRVTAPRIVDGCRPFHGLGSCFYCLAWGLRPRLYAVVGFADSELG